MKIQKLPKYDIEKAKAEMVYKAVDTMSITFNKLFTKKLRYSHVTFWRDLKRYAGVYEARGTWNGRSFKQQYVMVLGRFGLEEVRRYPVEWLR